MRRALEKSYYKYFAYYKCTRTWCFLGEKVTKFQLFRKKIVQKIMSKLIEYCMQNCRWHITQLYTQLFLRASKYISAKNALKKKWAKIQFAIFWVYVHCKVPINWKVQNYCPKTPWHDLDLNKIIEVIFWFYHYLF